MRRTGLAILVTTVAGVVALVGPVRATASVADAVDYTRDVEPIFARACAKCHGSEKPKAGFRMTSVAAITKGGVSGSAVAPGQPGTSYLMERLLGQGGEDRMPIEAPALTSHEIDVVRRWIAAGAVGPAQEAISFTPAPAGLRRLTSRQFKAAVRDLLDLTTPVSLDPDDRSARFTNIGAYKLTTSEGGSDLYRNAAFRLARAAFADPERAFTLVGCLPKGHLDDCGRSFLSRFGRRAFRRPLSGAELTRYGQVAERSARALGSPWLGLEYAVATMLQSPKFLYLAEVGVHEPGSRDGRLRLGGYPIATRLALFLWGTLPDDALLDAAGTGQLDSADGVRAAARRLLEAPAARASFRVFLDEHLGLGGLQRLDKEPSLYKHSTPTIGPAMRGEIERVFEDRVFDRGGDILELFDTRETFVTPELAKLYGLDGFVSEGTAYTRVTLPPDGPRAGLLGLGGMLAINGYSTRTSPTSRGVFVRERILCEEVPDPPPNVKSELARPSTKKPKGLREQLDMHANTPVCANCHKFFDPIGLSLERFDTIGAYRESDAGSVIATAGQIDDQRYDGAPGLGALLRRDPRTAACWVKSLYEYGAGHQVTPGDDPVLLDLRQRFSAGGHDIKTLLVEIAASDGFRYVRHESARPSLSRKAP